MLITGSDPNNQRQITCTRVWFAVLGFVQQEGSEERGRRAYLARAPWSAPAKGGGARRREQGGGGKRGIEVNGEVGKGEEGWWAEDCRSPLAQQSSPRRRR